MAKRCIYFIKNNQLYTRTVDVQWDKDALEVSKILCRKEIESSVLSFMEPCIDVSSASGIYQARNLATCYVKDSKGNPMRDIWKLLDDSPYKDYLPMGCHDLLYLTSLSEKQIDYALSQGSFYDLFHNPDKTPVCNARALAALQLLYKQGKIDYVTDRNMFLHWYYGNCSCPVEWVNKNEI
jgi:hypothetical protein